MVGPGLRRDGMDAMRSPPGFVLHLSRQLSASGVDLLAVLRVRYPERHCVLDLRVGQQHGVNVLWGNLLTTSIDQLFDTPRQAQVRTLLPRPTFAGLAKWEGNGSWPRHEAVRSRQPVRACSSSVERRIPNPRQRGFYSFLARQHQSGRSLRPPASGWRSVGRSALCAKDRVAARLQEV